MAEEQIKAKKKFFKRWWFWVIVVLAVIIAVAVSSGNDETADSGTDSNPKKVNEATDNNSEDGDSEDDDSEESVQTEFVKGDVVETDDLRITFDDCGNYKDYNEYFGPADGNKIIYANFEFENISDSDQYVSSYEFSCYADGYDCERYYYANEESLDATLSAGKKTKGMVFFEVPEDAEEITLEYEVNYFSSDKVVFVVK